MVFQLKAVFKITILLLFLKITPSIAIRNGSLSFVIDKTGSMYYEIEKVKEATTTLYNAIKQNSSHIKEIVLVTFNDPKEDKYATKLRLKVPTKSEDKLKTALEGLEMGGSMDLDCKEYSLSGLQTALNNSLRNSLLFVFTDAAPIDIYFREKDFKLAQAQASQVFFFLMVNGTGCRPLLRYKFTPYHVIAKATNGQVFHLNSTVGLQELIPFMISLVSGDRDVYKQIDIEPKKVTKIPFTVDDQIEYVFVSASGTDVKDVVELKISATPSEKYEHERIAWLRNIKILKLNRPSPGVYEVTVKGSWRANVLIFGRTDFTFHHGFSRTVPVSFGYDKKRPTEGTKYHLLVNVIDSSHSVEIQYAEILSMDEKLLIPKMPLKHESEDYYSTELFMPPNEMFKIKIVGEVKQTRKIITRTAKTPITPRSRNLAEILIYEKGGEGLYKFGTNITLKCHIMTQSKPTVIWKNEMDNVLDGKTTVQATQYKYGHVSTLTINVKKSAAYYCYAENYYWGENSARIDIKVESPFLVEDKSNETIDAEFNKPLILTCNIKSSLLMKITWYYIKDNKSKIINDSNIWCVLNEGKELRIYKVGTTEERQYFCVASILGDTDIKHTLERGVKITHYAPVVGCSEEVKVKNNENVTIKCNITKAYPQPKMQWQFKNDGKSIFQTMKTASESERTYTVETADLGHTGTYRCIAENDKGSQHCDTKLIVEAFPKKDVSDLTYIYLERGETKHLKCSNGSLQGRWFKEWHITQTKGTLTLSKVEDKDSGNYTCRTSDFESRTYVVLVGYKPSFNISEYVEEWTGKKTYLLCQTDMQPSQQTAKVEWFYNGKLLEKMIGSPVDSKHPITGWGTYICKVSNYHGTATMTYQVYSKDCLLYFDSEMKYPPLVLDQSTGTWPVVKLDGNYWNVKSNQSLLLFCPNGTNSNNFQKLPNRHEVFATCDHEDIFTVEGAKYRFSELQCKSEVRPSAEHTMKNWISKNIWTLIKKKHLRPLLEKYYV